MTATVVNPAEDAPQPLVTLPASWFQRLVQRVLDNRADYATAAILALAAALTRIWNIGGYPHLFTDENVYVSQGWAVQYLGRLANYTYWYDHPPLGWVQLAAWSMLTGSLPRHGQLTTMSGREYMVVMAIATTVLLYFLARRLGMRRVFAAAGSALYVLSPLAVSFSRYVLLDNIAIVWLLAAMMLALSPNRRLSAAIGSGFCMAFAALSKETALLMWPALIYMLVRHYWRPDRESVDIQSRLHRNGNRVYAIAMSLLVSMGLMSLYPIYAAVKNELFPGPGHVSLLQGQILFQLVSRSGSGSILQAGSDARLLAENAWLGLDPWLPWAGILALLPAMFIPRLWGPWLALFIQSLLLVVRQGYLPYPFIICMLPYMALLVAGVADAVWPPLTALSARLPRQLMAAGGVLAVSAMVVTLVGWTAPAWRDKLHYEFTSNETLNQRQALDWAQLHLNKNARLVTEGEYWLDIRYRGFVNPQVVWVYKLDTDPAVQAEFGDANGLDFLVLDKSTIDAAASGTYPTLREAVAKSTKLAAFGDDNQTQVQVLKVNHG